MGKKNNESGDGMNCNQWECVNRIDGHNCAVLSMDTYANMLVSTGAKTVKIWDIETNKMVSNLSGIYLNGNVRCVLVQPSKNIMFTAC
jgi:WD40 repeat protein